MITAEPFVGAEELAESTGWHLRPEGLCQADRCIPLPADGVVDGRIDVRVLSARAGFALVHDEERALWALGPQAGPTLLSDEVEPLVLTGMDGEPADVSALLGPDRGVLLAFASW